MCLCLVYTLSALRGTYIREVSLACEYTHVVLSVLVKCVFMHARTFFEENARAYAKIASKSQILEKYSVIPCKKLAKARVSLRASVKLNLSCIVIVNTCTFICTYVHLHMYIHTNNI